MSLASENEPEWSLLRTLVSSDYIIIIMGFGGVVVEWDWG